MIDDIPIPYNFCYPNRFTDTRKASMWKVICAYALYGEHGGRAYLKQSGMKQRSIDSHLRCLRQVENFDYAHQVLRKYGYQVRFERVV